MEPEVINDGNNCDLIDPNKILEYLKYLVAFIWGGHGNQIFFIPSQLIYL